jgi:hypothetical protein
MPELLCLPANTEFAARKPPAGTAIDREHAERESCRFFAALNENAGAYAYDAISEMRGALGGAPSWTAKPGALSFVNPQAATPAQYALFPSAFDPNSTPHTLCFLLELATLSSVYNNVFFALDANWQTANGWLVAITSTLQVVVGGPTFSRSTSQNTVPSAGKFILGVTYDASGLSNGGTATGIRVYVNGVEAAYATTTTNGTPTAAPGLWTLSYDNRGSGWFGGISAAFYAVAAFNRALNAQEIWNWGQQPFAAFVSSPTLAWEEGVAAHAAVLHHLAQLCA